MIKCKETLEEGEKKFKIYETKIFTFMPSR